MVEDDASMGHAIERILRAGGFASESFASAEAAIEADVSSIADCLVVDIELPGMSGLDFCHNLRQSGQQAPAIFITAHDEPSMREAAEKVAHACYLPKPFSGHALLDCIVHMMHSRPDVLRPHRKYEC